MAAKISLEDIEESLKCLVDPLIRATKQAQWDGIGGAKSYLDGGRIEIIERKYGAKIKISALKILFEKIVHATENALDHLVLHKFVEHNYEVIKAYAKENPEFFLHNKKVAEICKNALSPKERRNFHRLVKTAAETSSI